ncbi:MAG: response regulator [Kiritimatiellia bacterium]|jgi:DNA-binding NtrC family response regulator
MANILIIDDDPAVRDYLAALVTRLHHKSMVASTCAEGLKHMATPEVQIIIADIYLPDMSSPTEWIGQLKTHAAKRPLILITGEPSEELALKNHGNDILAFLTKPFELAFIKNLLTQATASLPPEAIT